MENVAKELGIATARADGTALSESELRANILAHFRALKSRADASILANDASLADCTVRIALAPAQDDGVGYGQGKLHGDKAAAGSIRGAAADMLITTTTGLLAQQSRSNDVRLIKGHSQILAVESSYFFSAFGGDWKERSDKSIDITLASEQEYGIFSQLIKLCYGPSYTLEDGQALDRQRLVQLLLMADRFEFLRIVEECAQALKEQVLTYGEAVEILSSMPETLARSACTKDLVLMAWDVIAKELGPVANLLEAKGEVGFGDYLSLCHVLKLSDKAKDLPLVALEATLQSNNLDVSSENEPFMLVRVWLEYRELSKEYDNSEAQEAFNQLARHLRFQHMSLEFLANIVLPWKRWQNYPSAWRVMPTALLRREPMKTALEGSQVGVWTLPPRAQRLRERSWTVSGAFCLAECQKLERGGMYIRRIFGLADGHPVEAYLRRTRDDRADVHISFWLHRSYDKEVMQEAPLAFKAALKIRDQAFGVHAEWVSLNAVKDFNGWNDPFNRSWDELLSANSPLITDGELRMEVTITFPGL